MKAAKVTTMRISFTALVAGASLSASSDAQNELTLEPRTINVGDVTYQADFGTITVPENRSDPESRSIRLTFARLSSTAEDPGPPVFYLPGGPGNAATQGAQLPIWEPFLELGDMVFLDPRGVGQSEADLFWKSEEIRSELFFGDRDTAVAHMVDMCALASEHFRARGIDLSGYNAREMADDIDALREALGYDKVNLMGHSWGTTVGFTTIRRHPDHVARFVAVGAAGPDEIMKLPSQLDRSLARLSAVVAADAEVGEAMPDLFASIERVVSMLETEPLPVTIVNPRLGSETTVSLGAFGLQLLLVADLADTSDLPVFPRLVRSLENRDPSIIRWFLQKRVDQFSSLPCLMLGARGSAGASKARWAQIRREAKESPFGLARCMFSPESDEALRSGDLGDDFRAPVTGDQPVLFVSGELDAATPVEQAESIRRGFANSGHLVVSNAGHEDLLPDPDVRDVIIGFFAGDEPRDARLEHAPLRFAPVEGRMNDSNGVQHPALATR